MAINCEEKIIELGETCAGIKVELGGMKKLLEAMSQNQTKLTRLGEKSLYFEHTQARLLKDHDEIFRRLRKIENLRPHERMGALEGNQKWLVLAFIGAVASITIRGLL